MSLCYRLKDAVIEALRGVNFSVVSGQKVAVVGRTGSGKSSLINCLLRCYEIEAGGAISVQGKTLPEFDLFALRRLISVIPQLGFIYKDTIYNNIDPENRYAKEDILQLISCFLQQGGRPDSREEMAAELRDSGGRVSKLLDLEYALDTDGKNLSSGERQIINAVRAIIRRSAIIILDEATSNLDPVIEQNIISYLLGQKNLTLICITHKLDTLQNFDQILVMDSGRLVEAGRYEELVSSPSSYFNVLRNCGIDA